MGCNHPFLSWNFVWVQKRWVWPFANPLLRPENFCPGPGRCQHSGVQKATCFKWLQNVAMNFNKGPFGEHHLGGDSCPPITFQVVPY